MVFDQDMIFSTFLTLYGQVLALSREDIFFRNWALSFLTSNVLIWCPILIQKIENLAKLSLTHSKEIENLNLLRASNNFESLNVL